MACAHVQSVLPIKAHALVASAGFQHPALAVAPERYIGAAEGQADTAPANAGA